jgi:hypothetical protein
MPSSKHARRQRTISFVTPRPSKLTLGSSSDSLRSMTSMTSCDSRRSSDTWESEEFQQADDCYPKSMPAPLRSEKHPRALKLAGFQF